MVNLIICIIAFLFFVVILSVAYVVILHWIEHEQPEQKPKPPIRKMEYDCTENYYHD